MAKKKIVYCRFMVRFDKGIECILVIHTGKGSNVFWPEKLISKEGSQQAISPSNQGKETRDNEKMKYEIDMVGMKGKETRDNEKMKYKIGMVGMKGKDVDNDDPTHELNLIPTYNTWVVLDFTISTSTNVANISYSLY